MLSIIFTGAACALSAGASAFLIASSRMRERNHQFFQMNRELQLVSKGRDFLDSNLTRYATQGTLNAHLYFKDFGCINIPRHLELQLVQIMQNRVEIIELFSTLFLLKPSFDDFPGSHQILIDSLLTNYYLSSDSAVSLQHVWPQAWEAYSSFETMRIDKNYVVSTRVLNRFGLIQVVR